jgi:c(7)-type cytochrome triheme protein
MRHAPSPATPAKRRTRLRAGGYLCLFAVLATAASAGTERSGRALPGGFHAVPAAPASPAPQSGRKNKETAATSFLDMGNPDYALLQKPEEAFANLPKDRSGKPDWGAALASGIIAPRADLAGTGRSTTLDLDILMTRTRGMPTVRFSHRLHGDWLACSNCHPAPFVARAGANRLGMSAIFRGESCGLCHGKVAFAPARDCGRCHVGQPRRGE